jgi:hypothetical protein
MTVLAYDVDYLKCKSKLNLIKKFFKKMCVNQHDCEYERETIYAYIRKRQQNKEPVFICFTLNVLTVALFFVETSGKHVIAH